MYVLTNAKDTEQQCSYTEQEMTEKVLERIRDIVPEDVTVEMKEIHITHARVFINGVNTHCDFNFLFPKAHIDWDASQSDPLVTMTKRMSEGKAEFI